MQLGKEQNLVIFGTGSFGKDLKSALTKLGYTVTAFVSTREPKGQIDGLPVLSLQQAGQNPDALVLIGILNPNDAFVSIKQQITDAGLKNILLPWDFFGIVEDEMGWRFWLKDKTFLKAFEPEIAATKDLLFDKTSKECLQNVFAFRQGEHLEFSDFSHPERHYFNEITMSRTGEINAYVDIGAYDGANYDELAEIKKPYCTLMFEPDTRNFSRIVNRMNKEVMDNIHVFPIAVTDKAEILRFNDFGQEDSSISETGNKTVLANSLDNLIPEDMPVSLIKMDVEGAESLVVAGAKSTIKRWMPTLCISLYHNFDDLWVIPAYINEHFPGYHLYLRQHMRNSFELVLYAVKS